MSLGPGPKSTGVSELWVRPLVLMEGIRWSAFQIQSPLLARWPYTSSSSSTGVCSLPCRCRSEPAWRMRTGPVSMPAELGLLSRVLISANCDEACVPWTSDHWEPGLKSSTPSTEATQRPLDSSNFQALLTWIGSDLGDLEGKGSISHYKPRESSAPCLHFCVVLRGEHTTHRDLNGRPKSTLTCLAFRCVTSCAALHRWVISNHVSLKEYYRGLLSA